MLNRSLVGGGKLNWGDDLCAAATLVSIGIGFVLIVLYPAEASVGRSGRIELDMM